MKINQTIFICSNYLCALKLHQVSLHLNEKQKGFFNDTFNGQSVHPLKAGEFGLISLINELIKDKERVEIYSCIYR